jgi:hypothetical protein
MKQFKSTKGLPGLVVFFVGLSMGFHSAFAGMGPKIGLEKKVKESKTIVHGRISSISPRLTRLSNGDEVILSRVVLDVSESLKGRAGKKISVEILGGTINKGTAQELTMRASDAPEPRPHEEVVLFLEADPDFTDAHRLRFGEQSYMRFDAQRKLDGKTLDEVRNAVRRGGGQ